MTIRHLIAGVTIPILLLGSMAFADLAPSERHALKTRLDSFEAAFTRGDIEAVVDIVPPPIMEVTAEDAGMEVADLRRALIAATRRAMSDITVISYDMDLDAATQSQTSAERAYALIPTTTVMEVDGTKMRSDTSTLAFADAGTWYLVRIDNANQIATLTRAYPEFAGVDFPRGTMQVLD